MEEDTDYIGSHDLYGEMVADPREKEVFRRMKLSLEDDPFLFATLLICRGGWGNVGAGWNTVKYGPVF